MEILRTNPSAELSTVHREGGGGGTYFPLLIAAVWDSLKGSHKSTLLVAALQLLATATSETLDLGGGDGGELRGEELGGESGLGVKGVDIDETVVGDRHRHCGELMGGGCVCSGSVLISFGGEERRQHKLLPSKGTNSPAFEPRPSLD